VHYDQPRQDRQCCENAHPGPAIYASIVQGLPGGRGAACTLKR